MPQIQVTLTPAESKRLIAKAVAVLPEVRNALEKGTIFIGMGTTNACVVEEILGRKIDRDRYVAGVILPKGTSTVPEEKRLRPVILRKGRIVEAKLTEVLDSLGPSDVVIKGANALDAKGTAGVFLASESGGTIGRVLGYVKARGAHLIIPVGLEKFIPGSIAEISKLTGTRRFEHATGHPVGVMPVSGKVVTEIESFKILTGARAVAMGAGGVSGAEGSVTLAVLGTARQLRAVRKLVSSVKGETFPQVRADS
jgi:hypothetical protein